VTKTVEFGKDLTGLEGLSVDQISTILDVAEPFKEISERPIKKVPVLLRRYGQHLGHGLVDREG
jgi:hypothetical protein